MSELQPQHDRSDGQHRQVVLGQLLVTSCDAPVLLQAVDTALDQIAPFVRCAVEPSAVLLVTPSRDRMSDPFASTIGPDLLAAIALVPAYPLGFTPRSSASLALDFPLRHQLLEHNCFVALSSS